MAETKKVKKVKLKFTGLILIVAFIALIVFLTNTILNLPIKNINITGTTLIKDVDIITICEIEDYPSIYKLNTKDMKEKIMSLDLVSDVKIKRNIFGKLTIDITELKTLFFNRSSNKLVLSNKETIDNDTYLGVPTLINYVPDTIYDDLIDGLLKIDYEIISIISEIEYSPSKNSAGETLDDKRFILRMNDGNEVIMNTVNIKRLNSYPTLFASFENEKGTVYLDSISTENVVFKSFAAQQKEIEEEKLKEEEAQKEAEKEKEKTNEQ